MVSIAVVDISIDMLVLTPWNCNEMDDERFAALVAEIEDHGFDEPLQVVPITEGEYKGKYWVVGGEHRYKAAVGLAWDTVPCVVKDSLSEADEADLMEWSVRRNNIRGRINEQKYARLEQTVCHRKDIQKDVARKRMLMREKQAKKAREKTGKDDRKSTGPDTDGERDMRKTVADRQRLLADAKAFQQECLVESADTVEHGYLYVAQNGASHLIVDADKPLAAAVKTMVQACKNESASVREFLLTAINKELPLWLDR